MLSEEEKESVWVIEGGWVRCGKSPPELLGPQLCQTWCQDEFFRLLELVPATLPGTCSSPAVNLERRLVSLAACRFLEFRAWETIRGQARSCVLRVPVLKKETAVCG